VGQVSTIWSLFLDKCKECQANLPAFQFTIQMFAIFIRNIVITKGIAEELCNLVNQTFGMIIKPVIFELKHER
jgi:hypothetical protein